MLLMGFYQLFLWAIFHSYVTNYQGENLKNHWERLVTENVRN